MCCTRSAPGQTQHEGKRESVFGPLFLLICSARLSLFRPIGASVASIKKNTTLQTPLCLLYSRAKGNKSYIGGLEKNTTDPLRQKKYRAFPHPDGVLRVSHCSCLRASMTGSISAEACVTCPQGSTTLAAGSNSSADCLACPPGTRSVTLSDGGGCEVRHYARTTKSFSCFFVSVVVERVNYATCYLRYNSLHIVKFSTTLAAQFLHASITAITSRWTSFPPSLVLVSLPYTSNERKSIRRCTPLQHLRVLQSPPCFSGTRRPSWTAPLGDALPSN